MKKIFAILLALCLLLTITAVAEEKADDEVGTTMEMNEFFTFDISMDAIPEGYTMQTGTQDGIAYAIFTCENKATITVNVAHSEEFDGYTMVLDELTAEQKDNMVANLTEDFYKPVVTYTKTTHGTDLIIVNENEVESDSVQITGIYDGYFINCEVYDLDAEVSQEAIDTAVQIISNMWFVPAAQ